MVLLLLFATVPSYAITYEGDGIDSDSLFEPIAAFLEEGQKQVFTIERINGDIQKVDLEVLIIEDLKTLKVTFAVNGMQIAPLTEGDFESIGYGLRLMIYQINVGEEKAGNPDGVEFSIEMDNGEPTFDGDIVYAPLPVAIPSHDTDGDLFQQLQRQKDELRNTAFWMSVGEERFVDIDQELEVQIEYEGTDHNGPHAVCELFTLDFRGGPAYEVFAPGSPGVAYVEVESAFVADEEADSYEQEVILDAFEVPVKERLGQAVATIPKDEIAAIEEEGAMAIETMEATVDPVSLDWREELNEIALVMGAGHIKLFISSDKAVVEAAIDLLKRDFNVYTSTDVDEFIKLNKIDKDMFGEIVQNARDAGRHTWYHGYSAYLALDKSDVALAKKEFELTKIHYAEYERWIKTMTREVNRWDPLKKSGFIYVNSFEPKNVNPNAQGYTFVDDGTVVEFRAVIESEIDQNDVPWILYNNGYPDGNGATKKETGKIDLKKGTNNLDLDMDFFYYEDSLYNTGSFITALRVGEEAYGGFTIYVNYPKDKSDDKQSDGTSWTESLCLREDDLGFSIFLYEKKGDEVLVAYNLYNHGYGGNVLPLPEPWDGSGSDGILITDIVKPSDKKVKKSDGQGCRVNGNTMPIGTRFIATKGNEEVAMYCDWTKETMEQKADGEKASNGYECLSAEERNGECTNTLNWLQKFFNWIFG